MAILQWSPLDISAWRKKYVKENAVYMRALRIDLTGDTIWPRTKRHTCQSISWLLELTLMPDAGNAPKAISGLATFTSDGTVIETDTSETTSMPVSAQLDTGAGTCRCVWNTRSRLLAA